MSSDVSEGHAPLSLCWLMCCLALLTAALQLTAWLTVLPAMHPSAFTLLTVACECLQLRYLSDHAYAAHPGDTDHSCMEPSMRQLARDISQRMSGCTY